MDKFNYVGGKYFDIMVKNLYLIEVIYRISNTTILSVITNNMISFFVIWVAAWNSRGAHYVSSPILSPNIGWRR